jgi:hypothetical protein
MMGKSVMETLMNDTLREVFGDRDRTPTQVWIDEQSEWTSPLRVATPPPPGKTAVTGRPKNRQSKKGCRKTKMVAASKRRNRR